MAAAAEARTGEWIVPLGPPMNVPTAAHGRCQRRASCLHQPSHRCLEAGLVLLPTGPKAHTELPKCSLDPVEPGISAHPPNSTAVPCTRAARHCSPLPSCSPLRRCSGQLPAQLLPNSNSTRTKRRTGGVASILVGVPLHTCLGPAAPRHQAHTNLIQTCAAPSPFPLDCNASMTTRVRAAMAPPGFRPGSGRPMSPSIASRRRRRISMSGETRGTSLLHLPSSVRMQQGTCTGGRGVGQAGGHIPLQQGAIIPPIPSSPLPSRCPWTVLRTVWATPLHPLGPRGGGPPQGIWRPMLRPVLQGGQEAARHG